MSDLNAKFTNDIRVIGDSITVQFFSLFYHYFLSANNRYIEKYHELMRTLKQNGDQAGSAALEAIFDVANTIPLAEIKCFLNSTFIEMPAAMLEEDELLPIEEEFFREHYPQYRRLLLRENFPAKDVHQFQDQMISFSRLVNPTLSEMEKTCQEAGALLNRKNAAASELLLTEGSVRVAAGSGGLLTGIRNRIRAVSMVTPCQNNTEAINTQIFDVLFRYCICWQNLIDILQNHAKELYRIYHGFFTHGIFNKYCRFYEDAASMAPSAANSFFLEFLEMEIRAYENEFDRKADSCEPSDLSSPSDPEERQTLRDVCSRVEDFFQSGNMKKFY